MRPKLVQLVAGQSVQLLGYTHSGFKPAGVGGDVVQDRLSRSRHDLSIRLQHAIEHAQHGLELGLGPVETGAISLGQRPATIIARLEQGPDAFRHQQHGLVRPHHFRHGERVAHLSQKSVFELGQGRDLFIQKLATRDVLLKRLGVFIPELIHPGEVLAHRVVGQPVAGGQDLGLKKFALGPGLIGDGGIPGHPIDIGVVPEARDSLLDLGHID